MPSQTIGATPSDVLGRNPGRLSLTLKNKSTGGQILYGSLTDSKGLQITTADYVLEVNEEKNFTFDQDGDDMRNPVAFIASAAGATLYFTETTIRRS
jgi:hypothetical protein